jgi:hypothetical protein
VAILASFTGLRLAGDLSACRSVMRFAALRVL